MTKAKTAKKAPAKKAPAKKAASRMPSTAKVKADDARIKDFAELLFSQALIAVGSPVKNPARFTKLVSELMVNNSK